MLRSFVALVALAIAPFAAHSVNNGHWIFLPALMSAASISRSMEAEAR